ncbi:hypothetical protein GCM10027299_45260 [Larkinella ripae]
MRYKVEEKQENRMIWGGYTPLPTGHIPGGVQNAGHYFLLNLNAWTLPSPGEQAFRSSILTAIQIKGKNLFMGRHFKQEEWY